MIHLIITILLGTEYYLQKMGNTVQVTSFLNIFIASIVFLLCFSQIVLLAAFYGALSLHHCEVCLSLYNVQSALCFRSHCHRAIFHRTILLQQ